jgi:hypothetical protein
VVIYIDFHYQGSVDLRQNTIIISAENKIVKDTASAEWGFDLPNSAFMLLIKSNKKYLADVWKEQRDQLMVCKDTFRVQRLGEKSSFSEFYPI